MNMLFAANTAKNGSVGLTKSLCRTQLIQTIAETVASHNMRNLGGIDRIEDLTSKEVDELPVAGTIFEVVAKELQVCGIETDGTVGSVMEGLGGFKRSSEEAAYYAHEIGCRCHGQYISPSVASQRILNLIGVVDQG